MKDLLGRIKAEAPAMLREAIDLLYSLTGCNTTDYHEKNGQERLEAFLKDMPCTVERVFPDLEKLRAYPEFNTGHTYEDRYCVVAQFKGEGGGRSLILNAHMDTVFPASPELWKTDPYTPTEIGDRIYALGAADDKGGMCAMLMAMKLIARLGVRLKGDVIFQSVVDEEAGGGNGTLAVIDAGYRADAALVAEPNMLSVASAQTGSYAVKITVEGKSAHGNMKELGVSAFEKALPLINRLTELEKRWKQRSFPLFQGPYLSILSIQAGDGSITLPSTCEMLGNYTYFPDGYDCNGDIRREIEAVEAADAWFCDHPIRVELHHDCGPYYTDPSTEWPQTVMACLQEIDGEAHAATALPTGADSRLYANVAKMPCVVMGPGTILVCHNPNEYIEKEQLMKAIIAYAAVICKWCGVC